MLRKRVLERNLLTRLEVVERRPCHSLRSIRRLIAVGKRAHTGNIAIDRDDLGGVHHGHAAVFVIHRGLLARFERIRNELDHILVKLGDTHALALHLRIGPRSRDLARVIGGRIQRAFANRSRKVNILRGRNGLVAHLRTAIVLRFQLLQRRGHRCDGAGYALLGAGKHGAQLGHFIGAGNLRIAYRRRTDNGAKRLTIVGIEFALIAITRFVHPNWNLFDVDLLPVMQISPEPIGAIVIVYTERNANAHNVNPDIGLIYFLDFAVAVCPNFGLSGGGAISVEERLIRILNQEFVLTIPVKIDEFSESNALGSIRRLSNLDSLTLAVLFLILENLIGEQLVCRLDCCLGRSLGLLLGLRELDVLRGVRTFLGIVDLHGGRALLFALA